MAAAAVVIDVLRATSTMAWALHNGAEAVQAFANLDELNAALGGVRFTAVSPLTRATSLICTSTRSCVSSGACHWESHNVFG